MRAWRLSCCSWEHLLSAPRRQYEAVTVLGLLRGQNPAIDVLLEMSKGKATPPWKPEHSPSALRVHHQNICGRSGGRSDSTKTIGLPPDLPRRILPGCPQGREAYRRLVPYTFLETSSKLTRETKKPFPPERKKWPTIAERLLTDSPTGQSFSTA